MMNRYFTWILTILLFLGGVSTVQAQKTDRWHIRQGNRLYRQGDIDNATTQYKMALAKDSLNPVAVYNMGRVLLQKAINSTSQEGNGQSQMAPQEIDSLLRTAEQMFQTAARLETNKIRKAMCWHNVGVMYQMAGQFKEAIEYYKDALRNNPNDDETRYNLAVCQKNLNGNKQVKHYQMEVFVKDAETKKPLPEAEVVFQFNEPGKETEVLGGTTNANGKVAVFIPDTLASRMITVSAFKEKYERNDIKGQFTAEELLKQPDDVRTIMLYPDPMVVLFQTVDSITGKPLPKVENDITVVVDENYKNSYKEISSQNGKFPVKAQKGALVSINSQLKGYQPKQTMIEKFSKPETIKMVPDQNQKKKQQQQQQNQKQNSDDNKDKNKDKKKDEGHNQNQDQNQNQQQGEGQPETQPNMSQDNVERLLEAAKQQEKETQERLQRAKRLRQRRQLDKNW